jgi:hypothetical protein
MQSKVRGIRGKHKITTHKEHHKKDQRIKGKERFESIVNTLKNRSVSQLILMSVGYSKQELHVIF